MNQAIAIFTLIRDSRIRENQSIVFPLLFLSAMTSMRSCILNFNFYIRNFKEKQITIEQEKTNKKSLE